MQIAFQCLRKSKLNCKTQKKRQRQLRSSRRRWRGQRRLKVCDANGLPSKKWQKMRIMKSNAMAMLASQPGLLGCLSAAWLSSCPVRCACCVLATCNAALHIFTFFCCASGTPKLFFSFHATNTQTQADAFSEHGNFRMGTTKVCLCVRACVCASA